MGKAIELVTGFVTAPGATLTAATMAAGNSLTVRNADLRAMVRLLSLWTDSQAAGLVQLRSPKLHDNVRGIRVATVISEVQPLLPADFVQPLVPQDQLIFEISGSAVGGDIETGCFLVYYDDLPGTDARLIDAQTLREATVDIVTVDQTLALGTTGGYTGEEAINAESDLLKANTDYALIGYQCSAEAACVRWRGVDTGNLGVGGPASDSDKHLTRDWFRYLSLMVGLPTIPVFNSANKGGFLIDGAQDENGADVELTSILAELKPGTYTSARR
jgi:hypothetical protein